MQLTEQTYVEAVAMLSQIAEFTENNTNEQTNEVLDKVASYLHALANFLTESKVMIDRDVSMTLYDQIYST